jgi:hypothetical protein
MDILFWILLFESENWHFDSEFYNLTSKNLFDLKFWYLNSELLFWNHKIYILLQKIIDWVLSVFSNNAIHNNSLLWIINDYVY